MIKKRFNPKVKFRTWISLWIPLSLGILFYNFLSLDRRIVRAPVMETDNAAQFFFKDSVRPLIKNYEISEVRSKPEIIIKKPSLFLALLWPREKNTMDSLYAFFILTMAIIALVKLWNFDYTKPFMYNLAKTSRWVAWLMLSFWAIDLIRVLWFDNLVISLTNDEYYYVNPVHYLPLQLWIGIILFRLSQLIKKGEDLQKEQELTI